MKPPLDRRLWTAAAWLWVTGILIGYIFQFADILEHLAKLLVVTLA